MAKVLGYSKVCTKDQFLRKFLMDICLFRDGILNAGKMILEDDSRQGWVLHVMITKLDTWAVPAKQAMSAKTRVELNFPSPSHEKKEAKSVPTLTYWKMADLAEWAGKCPPLLS